MSHLEFHKLKDSFVLLSKEEDEDLRRRAQGAVNLNLHLQEKELELRREKERMKKLEKELILAHKHLSELKLKEDGESLKPNDTIDVSEDLSSVDHRKTKCCKSTDSDLTMDNSVVFHNSQHTYTSQSVISLEKDSELSDISSLCSDLAQQAVVETDNRKQFRMEQKDIKSPCVFRFDVDPKTSSASFGGSEYVQNKENVDPYHMQKDIGVSEKYFNNLKQELIRVKQQLNQVLREKNTDLKKFETQKHYQQVVDNLSDEVNRITGERDEERNRVKSLNENLLLYKTIVKQKTEGVTFHHQGIPSSHSSSTDSKQSSRSITPQGSIKEEGTDVQGVINASQEKVTEKHDKQTSPMDPTIIPDTQQLLKDRQNKILKLETQLREAILARDKYRVNAREVSRNYEQLLKDLERPRDEDKLRKQKEDLEDENTGLNQKLSEYREEVQELYSNIEVIENNMSKEKEKSLRLEAMLREEQRCHGLTKHNLYILYGNLKTKYDRIFHEKNRLQQKLVAIQGEQTLSISSQNSTDSGQVLSNPEEFTHDYGQFNLQSSSSNSGPQRNQRLPGLDYLQGYTSSEQTDTFGRLPVESNQEFHKSAAEFSGAHSSDSSGVAKLFQCERCYAEFSDEMIHLEHIQKCLDD